MTTMTRHFVRFLSPGTFVAESSERPIDKWDVEQAKTMAREIKERHGATPYGFQFVTRKRTAKDLDSREVKRSGIYYLGGKVETLKQVEARATAKDQILLSNMRGNGYKRIITNDNSYRWTQPLNDDDVVLPWEAPSRG